MNLILVVVCLVLVMLLRRSTPQEHGVIGRRRNLINSLHPLLYVLYFN